MSIYTLTIKRDLKEKWVLVELVIAALKSLQCPLQNLEYNYK